MVAIMTVKFSDIETAALALEGQVVRTPMQHSRTLSQICGCDIYLKFENFQFTGSFKDRGAFIKLSSLPASARTKGVVAVSAGNHAQGVAYHAERLGIPATIVMPETTPAVKVERTQSFGAKVILRGEALWQCQEFAEELAARDKLALVHPFEDEHIIAGQGTVAREMLQDVPDLDVLVVPIGGGGLIAGTAITCEAMRPEIDIYGVQSELYPAMYARLRGAGYEGAGDTARADLGAGAQSLAEGIGVKRPGELTASIAFPLLKDILLVSEPALEHAVALLLSVEKTVAEGAGAAGLSAVLTNPELFRGRKVGLMLTGGNIDERLLSYVIQRELVRDGRIINIRVDTYDRAGFLGQVSSVIGEAGGNIIEVSHNRLLTDIPAKAAELGFIIEVRDRAHGEAVLARLQGEGFDPRAPERWHTIDK